MLLLDMSLTEEIFTTHIHKSNIKKIRDVIKSELVYEAMRNPKILEFETSKTKKIEPRTEQLIGTRH